MTRAFSYKQVIAVRTDLGMSKGKLAAQVAHGSLTAAERARVTANDVWRAWFREGQKKVVVKVSSEEELLTLRREAINHHLSQAIIHDAGMTELPPGTMTVIGIGPGNAEVVDKVTGHLKLL